MNLLIQAQPSLTHLRQQGDWVRGGMGEWVLDWTPEEAAQCWRELHWLWHSEGVKVNLISNKADLYSEATSESQSKTERVETVARSP